jgi:chromosome segregation ATPase
MDHAINAVFERFKSTEDPTASITSMSTSRARSTLAQPSMALAAINGGAIPRTGVDGESALRMVEQAAELIKEYERRFVNIEADARSFMSRIERDRVALTTKVEELQDKLEESETNARSLEGALRLSKLELDEARLKIKMLENRFNEAVSELFQSSSYFQIIQDKLGGLKSL